MLEPARAGQPAAGAGEGLQSSLSLLLRRVYLEESHAGCSDISTICLWRKAPWAAPQQGAPMGRRNPGRSMPAVSLVCGW